MDREGLEAAGDGEVLATKSTGNAERRGGGRGTRGRERAGNHRFGRFHRFGRERGRALRRAGEFGGMATAAESVGGGGWARMIGRGCLLGGMSTDPGFPGEAASWSHLPVVAPALTPPRSGVMLRVPSHWEDATAEAKGAPCSIRLSRTSMTVPGKRRARADATICDRSIAGRLADIDRWLKAAIRAGQFSDFWDHDHFPRYVWHREGERVFEARVVNPGDGS